jgi:hypothetical protein
MKRASLKLRRLLPIDPDYAPFGLLSPPALYVLRYLL